MKQEQSQRIQTSLLNAAEKKVLVWLAQRQPRWMTSDILTAIGVIGAIVVAMGYALSNHHVGWLHPRAALLPRLLYRMGRQHPRRADPRIHQVRPPLIGSLACKRHPAPHRCMVRSLRHHTRAQALHPCRATCTGMVIITSTPIDMKETLLWRLFLVFMPSSYGYFTLEIRFTKTK